MTAPGVPLPAPKEVRDLLAGLLGREVEVSPGAAPPAVGGDSGSLVALYVDDGLRTAAVLVADLALAARAGAALGLVPAGAADGAVASGMLPGHLRENADEVLNVLTGLFTHDDGPHLRLYSVTGAGQRLRPDLRALALRTSRREDVAVRIARYGSGVLSVVLA